MSGHGRDGGWTNKLMKSCGLCNDLFVLRPNAKNQTMCYKCVQLQKELTN